MSLSNSLGLTPSLTPPILTALHLAPLLSATASLTHAYMEYVTTSAFLDKPPITSHISKGILGNSVPSPPRPLDEKKKDDGDDDSVRNDGMKRLSEANELAIPAWFTSFFNRGIYSVVGFNSVTLAASLANAYWFLPMAADRARMWYVGGAVAAFAHYAFVPLVGASVRGLVALCAGFLRRERREMGAQKRAEEWLREWVGWHVVRMGTVDIVAWMCLFIGAVEALSERNGDI